MKNKVKKYREEAGLTQEELAKKAQVSRTTISDIENNKKIVTTNTTLEKIANALNQKTTDVFLLD